MTYYGLRIFSYDCWSVIFSFFKCLLKSFVNLKNPKLSSYFLGNFESLLTVVDSVQYLTLSTVILALL